ncbi:MAG: DUF1559 domain-containing protein [Planctomycetes bacterium]|nr:DUF1559 domain-containing protein [Planctomycetota bacterium]
MITRRKIHPVLFVGLLTTEMMLFLNGIDGNCLAQPATSQPSAKTDQSVGSERIVDREREASGVDTATTPSANYPDKALRFSLPTAIFSRQGNTRVARGNPAGPCQLVQGPVWSRGPKDSKNDAQITIKCATHAGSSGGEIKQADYWAFLQSYHRPFDTEKWFSGYASDVSFYHLLAPPFDSAATSLRLCRARIVRIGKDQITLIVPANCFDEFAPGTWTRLIPANATEPEFETVPLPAPVVFATEDNPMQLAEARLMRIGNAMHKYLGTLGYFPPSTVRGPDGTPWHSWRVLILPYLGQQEHELFRQYDLTKPWDDEHNLKLIAKMPEVYREPGAEHEGDTHSHFAVAVGEGTVFPDKGCMLPNKFRIGTFSEPFHELRYPPNNSSIRFAHHLRDGSANTALVGTVRTSEQIPWTRPVDVTLGTQPNLNGPDGFIACYRDERDRVALFLFADGRVHRVPATISSDVLHAVFTANGHERIIAGMIPKSPEYPGYMAQFNWFAEIREKDGSAKVHVTREAP